LFISCSKEENEEREFLPQITIYEPQSNEAFSWNELIKVKFYINHVRPLTHVQISIKDENNVPHKTKDLINVIRNADTEFRMQLDDPELEGRYYIEIKAFDDLSFGAAFRYINIGGGAKTLNSMYFFQEGSGNTELYKYDTAFHHLSSLYGDFLESTIDPKSGNLYSVGSIDGDLNSLDTSGNVKWKYLSARFQYPYFRDLLFHDNIIFTSTVTQILGFDQVGNRIFEKTDNSSNERINKIHRHEARLLYSKEYNGSGGSRRSLVDVYYPSGNVVNEITNFQYGSIETFYSVDANNIILLSSQGNTAYVSNYNTQNLSLHLLEERDSRSGPVVSMVELNPGRIAFVRDNHLYEFDVEKGQTELLIYKSGINCIRMDPSRNILWTITDSQLKAYDTDDWSLIHVKSLPEEFSSFELVATY